MIGALLKIQDVEYDLKKAQRDVIKESKEINKRNPNPSATEKEKYAYAEARNPQLFQKVEDLKRVLMDAHRELSDTKIDIGCVNKFAHDCSASSCTGLDDFPWPAAKAAKAKSTAKTTISAAKAKTTKKADKK